MFLKQPLDNLGGDDMDVMGSLVFLIIMIFVINIGAIVRLKFFNNLSWKTLKWVLIIGNVILLGGYIIYFFILEKGLSPPSA